MSGAGVNGSVAGGTPWRPRSDAGWSPRAAVVCARGQERRWPVHRLGVGVSNAPPSGSGPVRATVPTRESAPASTLVLDAHLGIPGERHYRQAAQLVKATVTTKDRMRRWRSTCPKPIRCWSFATCSGIPRCLLPRSTCGDWTRPGSIGRPMNRPGSRTGCSPTRPPNKRATSSSAATTMPAPWWRSDAGHDSYRSGGDRVRVQRRQHGTVRLDGLPCRIWSMICWSVWSS